MASNPPNPDDAAPQDGEATSPRPAAPPPGQRVPPFVNRPGGAAGAAAAGGAAPAARQALAAAAARPRPAAAASETQQPLVYVWPHLVLIEFMSAVLMLFSLLLLSTFINAPLIGHANPDHTPNPSKAPWYFLNLQELLLHMHPALAGVIVPGVVVFVAIPLIPYIDRDTRDVGKWFGTAKAVPIAIFS